MVIVAASWAGLSLMGRLPPRPRNVVTIARRSLLGAWRGHNGVVRAAVRTRYGGPEAIHFDAGRKAGNVVVLMPGTAGST